MLQLWQNYESHSNVAQDPCVYQSSVTQPASLAEQDSLFSDALLSGRPANQSAEWWSSQACRKTTHPTENSLLLESGWLIDSTGDQPVWVCVWLSLCMCLPLSKADARVYMGNHLNYSYITIFYQSQSVRALSPP